MSKDLFYQQRALEVAELLTHCEAGNIPALLAYANLKQTKDLIDEAIEQIEPLAQDEASLHAEKTFSDCGFTFEKRNGATRYSFTHIPKIKELKDEIKEIETKSKQAYISMQKNLMVADENGEEIPLPKVTYSKDSLIVKK